MSTPDWINRSIAKLLPNAKKGDPLASSKARAASLPRSTGQRLEATLRRGQEALSPRVLRRTLVELQGIADPQVSEVEGGRRAMGVIQWYAGATPEQRRDAWLLMSEQFGPDAKKVSAAREQYDAAQGTGDEGSAEIRLRRAFVSPRTRLLKRFAVAPQGMRFLLELRSELLPQLKTDKRLVALDAELEGLFSTWFDLAFLELRRISWDSPASLIEKLMHYEAVHDIRSWADVKNRLDSDRRCYGFFHPNLPDEPLIFIEVAFTQAMADGITPLLDEGAASVDPASSSTAIFYSISNTQRGLRGVSFGDSLIKRVVETLHEEFPKLRHFATLSPIPGLRGWLGKNAAGLLDKLDDKERLELGQALGSTPPSTQSLLTALEAPLALPASSPVRQMLLRCAAHYLAQGWGNGKPLDAVARFHLGNGARVERLNWGADPSAKGLKQSWGLMVNYLYDLKRLDKHRALLAQGTIPVSGDIESLHF